MKSLCQHTKHTRYIFRYMHLVLAYIVLGAAPINAMDPAHIIEAVDQGALDQVKTYAELHDLNAIEVPYGKLHVSLLHHALTSYYSAWVSKKSQATLDNACRTIEFLTQKHAQLQIPQYLDQVKKNNPASLESSIQFLRKIASSIHQTSCEPARRIANTIIHEINQYTQKQREEAEIAAFKRGEASLESELMKEGKHHGHHKATHHTQHATHHTAQDTSHVIPEHKEEGDHISIMAPNPQAATEKCKARCGSKGVTMSRLGGQEGFAGGQPVYLCICNKPSKAGAAKRHAPKKAAPKPKAKPAPQKKKKPVKKPVPKKKKKAARR